MHRIQATAAVLNGDCQHSCPSYSYPLSRRIFFILLYSRLQK